MGGKGSGGQNRLTPEQHRLRGTYREDRHGLPRARARRSDAARGVVFDELLIRFFLVWDLPREAPEDLWLDLFEESHPNDLSGLRRHWIRLRDVVCGRWRAATLDERRAWFEPGNPAIATATTRFPPAQWTFEMLGRSEDESETAFRRRRGLESTAIEDDDSDRDDQDDDVEDD